MTAPDPAAPPAVLPVDRALLRELFARQEAVRQQVARALHNEIGQAVSAIKMSAHLAMEEDDAAQRREDIGEIVRIADDTVARLRDLYSLLRPPQLDALGLHASLRGEAEAWRTRWSLEPQIAVALAEDARPAAVIELTAFRLVQDLLAPQPRLSRLAIDAGQLDDALVLHIEHDGAAPDAATLALLQLRAEAQGGRVQLAAGSAGPVEVQAWLPWTGAGA